MTTEEVHAQMAAVFQRLRPVCVELAGNHTCGNVRALELILSEVTDDELSELQEYVLFPLRLILKQSSNRLVSIYMILPAVSSTFFPKTVIPSK